MQHDPVHHRPKLEQWLKRSAARRKAYADLCEIYQGVGVVRREDFVASRAVSKASRRAPWRLELVVALMVGAGGSVWALVSNRDMGSDRLAKIAYNDPAPLILTTDALEVRRMRLSDGSWVTLDGMTRLDVSFSPRIRELRVERGRVRFEVRHEDRAFVVDAAGGSVTAHGTIFDVAVDGARNVQVGLLRGSISVRMPLGRSAGGAALDRRLKPGAQISYNFATERLSTINGNIPIPDWPTGTVEFDDATLQDVVNEANRHSTTKIGVRDAKVANLGVSGTFAVNDTAKLAEHLAMLFGLKTTRTGDAIILGVPPAD